MSDDDDIHALRSRLLVGSISSLPLGEYRLSIIENGAFVAPVNSNATAIGRDGERLAVVWRDDDRPLDAPSQDGGER